MTFQDDVNAAGWIAKGSTRAMIRAGMVGIVPIVEFGLLIALTLIVVALPIKLIRRVIDNG